MRASLPLILPAFVLFTGSCSPFDTGATKTSNGSDASSPTVQDAAAADASAGSDAGRDLDGGDDDLDAGPIGVFDPTCARSLLLGSRVVLGSPDNVTAGSVDAYGFSVPLGSLDTIVAHCLWVFIQDGGNADVVVGVYDSSIGQAPTTLRSRGIISKAKIGWNAAVLDPAVVVSPATTLWLATSPVNGTVKLAVNTSCTANQLPLKARTSVSPGDLPNPFEHNFMSDLCGASMYLAPKR